MLGSQIGEKQEIINQSILITRELASSTAVSEAIFKGDKGALKSPSSLIATIVDGIKGRIKIVHGRHCGRHYRK